MNKISVFSACAAISLACGVAMGQKDGVLREGAARHREMCDKLELSPVPANMWNTVSDWTNGDALTPENTKGKVVLIGTWWSAYSPSHIAIVTLQRMAEQYGKDDLVVVGLHYDSKFENAKQIMESKKGTFLYGRDVDNKVRTILHTDQDPDFYVIDRAGQFRYVDILTGSVDKAVEIAVKETAEAARNLPERLQANREKARLEANKTTTISGRLKPGELLDLPFTPPPPEDYTAARWPEVNKETNLINEMAKDVQGQAFPATLSAVTWLSKTPVLPGRAMVVCFWTPLSDRIVETLSIMNSLHQEFKQDASVIGISFQTERRVRDYLANNRSTYYQAIDELDVVWEQLGVKVYPVCYVVSTDGVVRWMGHPWDSGFRRAVRSVVTEDPGIKTRQKAEAEYLKTLKDK
ncbi:MAG: peroxiredoxin family protein [Phycisphaerales bacterium]